MLTPYAVLGLPQNASKDQVKLAYEAILRREAGYRPPPPGSHPNVQNAEAYWHAHSADGRVPWGQFAGWAGPLFLV
eukprot:gene2929-3215_t